jgi:hypothetical protein
MVGHFGVIHPLGNLKITGRKPYANIDLDRLGASLYVTADEENGSGVFLELDNVLAPRQRRWPILYSGWFVWTLILLNISSSFIRYNFGWESTIYSAAFSLVVLFWVFWTGFFLIRRSAVINLKRHSERTSFFQRKKDELILAVISLVLGTLIGIFGTKLADRFLKVDADTTQKSP